MCSLKMVVLKNKIKSTIAAEILSYPLPASSQISNERLVRFTYLAEKILTRDDPIVNKSLNELRRYFKENHPCVELAKRLARNLNPKCKKTLIKTFFVNAIFKGVSQTKEYADKEGFLPPWFLVLSPTMRCNLNCLG